MLSGPQDMTPQLEQALRSVFKLHYDELLELGRKEDRAYELRQHERGDEWVIGGYVSFEVQLDGYKLLVSYVGDVEEHLTLLGGSQLPHGSN
jgi:hypothetical protein